MPADLMLKPRSNIPASRFNVQTGWADKDNPAWDALPVDRRADRSLVRQGPNGYKTPKGRKEQS